MADEEQHDRIVLLNTMLSFSTSRAQAHEPPTLGALESLKAIDARRKKGWAAEFSGLEEKSLRDAYKDRADEINEEEYETDRFKAGLGHHCVRLRALRFEQTADFTYATLLIEEIDVNNRTFAVVNMETFDGREINAEGKERGSAAAHVVVRIPNDGANDIGKYRCAIETVHPITRTDIDGLLNRQLRRYADWEELTFQVTVNKGKKPETKNYRFTPRLQLVADVGRKLSVGAEGRTLAHMLFTKRAEKTIIGKGVAAEHEEVYADIELKISASQGPVNEEDRKKWAQQWADAYRKLDYEVKFYFRNATGRIESGNLHKAIAGATDLLMCPREQIMLKKAPKKWVSTINADIASALKELTERDELWERSK